MSETAIARENAQTDDDTPVVAPDVPGRAGLDHPLGLIGLGVEGAAAGLSLLAQGYQLLACDQDAGRRQAYAEAAGAEAVVTGRAEELAERCAIILLFLKLGEDAATVYDALLGLPPGALIIDCGPALPGETRKLAEFLAGREIRLVDAPSVATFPPTVLLGGAPEDVALAEPVLAALGEPLRTGPAGSAQALSALLAEFDGPPDRNRILSLLG